MAWEHIDEWARTLSTLNDRQRAQAKADGLLCNCRNCFACFVATLGSSRSVAFRIKAQTEQAKEFLDNPNLFR
jgi:hypothetical protein